MSRLPRRVAVENSVKVKFKGAAYTDLISLIDTVVDDIAVKIEDIDATVADIHRMMLEQQADLSLVMRKVGASGILAAGDGKNEKRD